jgi:hypothetical protein
LLKPKTLEKSISLKRQALVDCGAARVREKRGPQNEGKSNDVIENKCRKNVSFAS